MSADNRSARQDAHRLMTWFSTCNWGCHAEFAGTGEELVGAGLLEASWLAEGEFGKSGVRTRSDQYGNQIKIQRRARGHFEVTIRTLKEDAFDLNAKATRKMVWFREHGAELDQTVVEALTRMRLPARDRGA